MAAIPSSLMSPPRVSLQVAPPAVHSVLLVSNLNPEVRGYTESFNAQPIKALPSQVILVTLSVSAEHLASLPLHPVW